MTAPTLLPPSNTPCDCEGYDAPGCVSCRGCYSCLDASGNIDLSCNIFHKTQRMDQTQKRIQGVVRAPSSLFTMNLAAFNVFEAGEGYAPAGAPYPSTTQTQSDRRRRHKVPVSMGTYRGSNSTKYTKTSLRPGATNAPGTGVDVKHGSYARYLAKKKGTGPLRGQASANSSCQNDPRVPSYQVMRDNPHITTGGKNVKFGMIAACYCSCSN